MLISLQSELEERIEEIKQLREKMKEAADEARGKEEMYRQLVWNFSTFPLHILKIVSSEGDMKKFKQIIYELHLTVKLNIVSARLLLCTCFPPHYPGSSQVLTLEGSPCIVTLSPHKNPYENNIKIIGCCFCAKGYC